MILGFKDRFVLPIELGTKVQSIRKPRKGRDWRKGDMIHMTRGDRFHPVRIGLGRALSVDPIILDLAQDRVTISAETTAYYLIASALDAFAVQDGFADWADLKRFWADTHPGTSFQGNRIFWGSTFAGPLDPEPAPLPA